MTDTAPGAHPLVKHLHAVGEAHHRVREHHRHVAHTAHGEIQAARDAADARHHARHDDGTDTEGEHDAG